MGVVSGFLSLIVAHEKLDYMACDEKGTPLKDTLAVPGLARAEESKATGWSGRVEWRVGAVSNKAHASAKGTKAVMRYLGGWPGLALNNASVNAMAQAAVNADLARLRQRGADYAVINTAIGKKTALRAAFPAQVAELTDTVVERMEIKIAKHVLQGLGIPTRALDMRGRPRVRLLECT